METCPRCGGELTREDNEDVASIWRVDKDGVVICCHQQVTELLIAFCSVCNFREVIDFQKSESVRPLHALVVFN